LLRFAIVCLGRTGSEHLVSLLNSHRDIECCGEVFGDGPIERHGYTDPEAYLVDLIFPTTMPVLGMKLPIEAFIAHPGLTDIMGKYDFRVIRLTRENLFDQYLSMLLSQRTGKWDSTGDGYGHHQFEIELWRVRKSLEYFRDANVKLREMTLSFIAADVTYEQIVSMEAMPPMFRLLQVDPLPLSSRRTKQRAARQSEIVANYAEIARGFAGTEWERYLTG
jgi:hypothetical protein